MLCSCLLVAHGCQSLRLAQAKQWHFVEIRQQIGSIRKKKGFINKEVTDRIKVIS